jgi:ribonuclease I
MQCTMILLLASLSLFSHKEIPYNYYEFAVQNWCNNSYNIHGLWPQYYNNTYPSWCRGPNFKQITGSQLDAMNKYWNASCTTLGSQSFWEHEWLKHGTCFAEQTGLQQTQYFDIALQLFISMLNESKTWTCGSCIVACFDLSYRSMQCTTH